MQFASFSFIFLFLPVALAVYHLTPARQKHSVMLGISLIFLLSGGFVAAMVLLLLTAFTYGAGLLLGHLQPRRFLSGLLMTGVILIFLGTLLLLRSDWVQGTEGKFISGRGLYPVGLAFFALQGMGYCADIRNKKIMPERRPVWLFLYMLFFPRLLMGPVVSYRSAQRSSCPVSFSMEQIGGGMMRFVIGLSKNLLLAQPLALLFDGIVQAEASYSVFMLWVGLLAKLTALFLELSGYSDMAVGLAICFGFRLPESYGKSALFPTVIRFSETFNRTVVQWFSHYVGGKFRTRSMLTRNLAVLATWGCIGLWYQFRLTSLIWGIFIGLCICVEHAAGANKHIRYPVAHHILTIFLLCGSILLLVLPDLSSVGMYFRNMQHFTLTDSDLYLLRSDWLALVVGLYAASGNWRKIIQNISDKLWFRRIQAPLTVLAIIVLLLACIAVLMTEDTMTFQLML